jgi:hypothetical protein
MGGRDHDDGRHKGICEQKNAVGLRPQVVLVVSGNHKENFMKTHCLAAILAVAICDGCSA